MRLSSSDDDEQRRRRMDVIFREHFSAVHRYVSRLVRRPDVADDLTSMVFLRAFRWLLEDRGVGQVRSWLYATARSIVADYWQEQQKSLLLPLERIEDIPAVLCEPQDNEQVQQYVYHLLHLLPERERQVLLLRYFQGYSTAEIGQQLGLKAGYVRVLQLRALRRAAMLDAKERSHTLMQESTNEPITSYTQQGERVLELAKAEALSLRHPYLGTEHLLLGILREGSAAGQLTAQGVTYPLVRAELLSTLGECEPDPSAEIPSDTPLTPRSQRILALAGEGAKRRGETAIGPEHILRALVNEKHGLAVQILQSIGVELAPWQEEKKKPTIQENEEYLRELEKRIAQKPQLDEEEERRLAHLVARGRREQRRAKLLKESADAQLIEQGDAAYFELIPACQHLVLSVAKEYLGPGRDLREIVDAANAGLSLAAVTFGLKQRTSFRSYARHMMHLQIINYLE
ncbi:MAG: sigma-70 family RNA polymerase sigma factor [Ktedonobacteraceae bacterium]|nr:sigma-70 family RNA polymerase sigma factor [Ktedonobacteraceae bacterium]